MEANGTCSDLFNIKGFDNMKRGAVWMVDLGYNTLGSEQDGQKTCVIVQNDIGNSKSPTLIVAVITSKCKNNIPTHVEIDMFAKSTVLCEQIKTIDKNRLYSFVGNVSEDKMKEIDNAMIISLGLGA